MSDTLYDLALKQSTRVGKLLGTIGAMVKYDNPDLPNWYFTSLAKVYIENNTCQTDIGAVMAQAEKRGVKLS
jgi:hypothetical protein